MENSGFYSFCIEAGFSPFIDPDSSDFEAKKMGIHVFLKDNHIGKQNAVKSRELEQKFGYCSRSIRNCISALRREGVPICSNFTDGYYYAENYEEIMDTTNLFSGFGNSIDKLIEWLFSANLGTRKKPSCIELKFTYEDGTTAKYSKQKKEKKNGNL